MLRRFWPLTVLAALLAILWALLPRNTFWCVDEANRYLQVHALSQAGAGLPPALPFPGAERIPDPELLERLRPLPGQYGFLRNGRLYSQYSPLLALTAVPFHVILGPPGIYLPPMLGGMTLVLILAFHLRKKGFPPGTGFLLAVLGTPVLFYSLTFFSHTLALALGLACVGPVREKRYAAASLPAALALSLRPEMLFGLPLLLLTPEKTPGKRGGPVVAILLAAALFLVLQKSLTGEWLGTHLAGSGSQSTLYGDSQGWFAGRMYILSRGFLHAFPGSGPAAPVLGIALWLTWTAAAVMRNRPVGRTLTLTGLCLAMVPLVALGFRGFPSVATMDVQNPLVGFPLLWLVRPGRREAAGFLAVLGAMVLFMSPMHVEDVAWGFRLGFFPLLLMGLRAQPRTSDPWPTRGVLLLGAGAALVSLSLLFCKRERGAQILSILESGNAPVITTSWEQPQELASLMASGVPVLHAATTLDLFQALSVFREDSPLVMTRRESIPLLFSVMETAGLRPDLLGAGSAADPLTRVVVFRCVPR